MIEWIALLRVRAIIAAITLSVCFYFVYSIMRWAMAAGEKDIIIMITQYVLGVITGVTGFYFISSHKDKEEQKDPPKKESREGEEVKDGAVPV